MEMSSITPDTQHVQIKRLNIRRIPNVENEEQRIASVSFFLVKRNNVFFFSMSILVTIKTNE